MKTFKDKTVLITGASSGIGEEFARLLAAEKANVVLTARSEKKLNALTKELSDAYEIQTHAFPADLSRPETPARLFVEIQKFEIDVDVVINNAGFGSWGNFQAADNATYQEMCNLNMNAIVALSIHPPAGGWGALRWQFALGILMAAVGGCLVTLYKPGPAPAPGVSPQMAIERDVSSPE